VLLLASTAAGAQQLDSARVGAGTRSARAAAPVVMQLPADSLKPPISPGRAFLSSLLLPGLGQASMDRPFGTALFATVEAGALVMLIKSRFDLDAARDGLGDSVVVRYAIDPTTGQPVPAEYAPGPYTEDLVRARKLHYEDWLFVLIFNHVIAGADAFVAAQLWDVPTVSASMTRDGAAITARLRW
jgi:hypothetical protein